MVVRLKNHTDVLIFQPRVCVGVTNSESQLRIKVFLRKTFILSACFRQKSSGMEVKYVCSIGVRYQSG